MNIYIRFLIGFALSALVATAAWKKGSLSTSGLIAAITLGTVIFLLGDLLFWSVLIIFFVTSSLLSKYKSADKHTLAEDFSKTGRRDWLQVLANGSIGLSLAFAYYFSDNNLVFAVGYVGSFAAVNADTWATELGILSKHIPVSIVTFKPTTPGASGAVTWLGTGAAFAGAALIAMMGSLGLSFAHASVTWPLIPAIIACGGFSGAMLDSLLGATVQAMYRCPECGKLTEKKNHHNLLGQRVKGLAFIQNDTVNCVSSLVGAVVSMGLYLIINNYIE